MKILKLKKNDFNSLGKFLKRVGATSDHSAYPSHVYVAPKHEKTILKNLRQEYRKAYPGITKEKLQYAVELHYVNLSPVYLKGLPDNLVLVDDSAIKQQIESHKKFNKTSD